MRHPITEKRLLHLPAAAAAVPVERDLPYGDGLTYDRYGDGPAAMVLVTGLPDPGVEARMGAKLKDWQSFQDWARLLATGGVTAITYENRATLDVYTLIGELRAKYAEVGIWACSGHGPMALSVLAHEPLSAAVLLYPYVFDVAGSTSVAEAVAKWGFASAGASIDALPTNVPIVIGRAGRDAMPALLPGLDAFTAELTARGAPITVVDHPNGVHAYDLEDSSEEAARAIARITELVWTTGARSTS